MALRAAQHHPFRQGRNQRSSRLEPNKAGGHYCRAFILLKKDDADNAIKELDDVTRITPSFAKAYLVRAVAWHKKGDDKRAIADFDEAIRLQPGNSMSYNNRAGAFRDIGDHARALADYNEAIRLDPNNQTALVNRGILYMKMSDAAKARADFNSVFAQPMSDKWAGSRRACLAAGREVTRVGRAGALHSVIASVDLTTASLRGALATKQSRILPRKDSGLLRYAPNDEERASLYRPNKNGHAFVRRHARQKLYRCDARALSAR
jgi:Flp pilus assembly protein TadD